MGSDLHKYPFRAMGGPCEVVVAGTDAASAARVAAAAREEVERIERKYSRYRDDSVVSAINRSAGGSPVSLDDETLQLLHTLDLLYRASGGRFDATSGVLRRAWQFKDAVLPAPETIQALLPLIDWPAVERDGDTLRLPRAGMELDFGGIGKEYAADRGAQALQQAGVTHGYVNLAGDLRVLGPKPDGEPWHLGIQHPREQARMIASIPVSGGALATSGDYERFIEVDGTRYCHILDPRTGYPVRHWQSVSVLAPNAVTAGSFSTVAMLLEQDGLDFLRQAGLPFLAIDHAGRSWQDQSAGSDSLRHPS